MKRDITLMLYIEKAEDIIIKDLKEYCLKEGLLLKSCHYRSPGNSLLYDFIIEGNTADYNKLADKFGDRLAETCYAELGNIFNLDNDQFKKWKSVIERYRAHSMSHSKLFSDFCDLMKDIEDVDKFEYLLHYHFDELTKTLIKDRIAQLKGEKTEWEHWMDDCLRKQELVKVLKLVQEGQQVLSSEDITSIINVLEKSMQ